MNNCSELYQYEVAAPTTLVYSFWDGYIKPERIFSNAFLGPCFKAACVAMSYMHF